MSDVPAEIVERLRPIEVGLRQDLVVSRQQIGGRPRYVVHDPVTFQSHAIELWEYQALVRITPDKALEVVFREAVEDGQLDAAGEEEFFGFVLELHGLNLLQLPMANAEALFKRYARKRDARRRGWMKSVMYLKMPLFNPDPFLNRTVHLFRWLFSRIGVCLWLALFAGVAIAVTGRIDEMFTEMSGILALSNLPIIWLALVVLKVLHEFGHAYACKRFGGIVPEMGVAFILLTPCAYVDAGASWTFSSRWHRIVVGLGGMYVESIIALLAALLWVMSPAGFVHDVALNIVVLSSLVTLSMNLNPLMKFDGYYVLSDLLGVINLRQRADDMLRGFARRVALGLDSERPHYGGREAFVYACYAPCSFLYKLFLAVAITSMIVMQWPGAGLFLGAVFAWFLVIDPLSRLAVYLLRSEDTAAVRQRARWVAVGCFVALPVGGSYLPISTSVLVPGVLEPMDVVSVRAPLSSFVTDLAVDNGAAVRADELLCVLTNPELEARRAEIESELRTEEVKLDVDEVDPNLAAVYRARVKYLRGRVVEIQRQAQALRIRAARAGTFVRDGGKAIAGRFVGLGDEIFQIHSEENRLRIVLTDDQVLRAHLTVGSTAEVRWTSDPSRTVAAVVREIRRSASRADLPVELTNLAGGDIYAHQTGNQEVATVQPYLHVFLEVDGVPLRAGYRGLTARVRVPARMETLGGWVRRKVLAFYYSWRMS